MEIQWKSQATYDPKKRCSYHYNKYVKLFENDEDSCTRKAGDAAESIVNRNGDYAISSADQPILRVALITAQELVPTDSASTTSEEDQMVVTPRFTTVAAPLDVHPPLRRYTYAELQLDIRIQDSRTERETPTTKLTVSRSHSQM
jgi:hypothetical protein